MQYNSEHPLASSDLSQNFPPIIILGAQKCPTIKQSSQLNLDQMTENICSTLCTKLLDCISLYICSGKSLLCILTRLISYFGFELGSSQEKHWTSTCRLNVQLTRGIPEEIKHFVLFWTSTKWFVDRGRWNITIPAHDYTFGGLADVSATHQKECKCPPTI
jgi:hypothetical protein